LSTDALVSFGQKMKQNRLRSWKTRKQMALELGVSPKTLWGWETDRWQPTAADDGTFF
jgi:DNA-binding XRE family transcriptional regulator